MNIQLSGGHRHRYAPLLPFCNAGLGAARVARLDVAGSTPPNLGKRATSAGFAAFDAPFPFVAEIHVEYCGRDRIFVYLHGVVAFLDALGSFRVESSEYGTTQSIQISALPVLSAYM